MAVSKAYVLGFVKKKKKMAHVLGVCLCKYFLRVRMSYVCYV